MKSASSSGDASVPGFGISSLLASATTVGCDGSSGDLEWRWLLSSEEKGSSWPWLWMVAI